jgi:hypothetical protein
MTPEFADQDQDKLGSGDSPLALRNLVNARRAMAAGAFESVDQNPDGNALPKLGCGAAKPGILIARAHA